MVRVRGLPNPGPLPWQGSAQQLSYTRMVARLGLEPRDTRLFRPLLYQLSYLAGPEFICRKVLRYRTAKNQAFGNGSEGGAANNLLR